MDRHWRVVVTGSMGIGKTTISNLLATATATKNIGSDNKIEQLSRLGIKIIFEVVSEAQFRKWELELVHGLTMSSIVNTGGGTALFSQCQHRTRRSMTLSLESITTTIVPRLRINRSRPLMISEDYWKRRLVPGKLCSQYQLHLMKVGLLGALSFGVGMLDEAE